MTAKLILSFTVQKDKKVNVSTRTKFSKSPTEEEMKALGIFSKLIDKYIAHIQGKKIG